MVLHLTSHVCVHTHTHTHTHARAHTHTHTHTHTCKNTNTNSNTWSSTSHLDKRCTVGGRWPGPWLRCAKVPGCKCQVIGRKCMRLGVVSLSLACVGILRVTEDETYAKPSTHNLNPQPTTHDPLTSHSRRSLCPRRGNRQSCESDRQATACAYSAALPVGLRLGFRVKGLGCRV